MAASPQPIRTGDILRFPATPWSARIADSGADRRAIELYDGAVLMDIVVATPMAPELLRGVRRGVWGGKVSAVAWGRLVAQPGDIALKFKGGFFRPRTYEAEVVAITDYCWMATATGDFRQLLVSRRGEISRRLPIRREPAW